MKMWNRTLAALLVMVPMGMAVADDKMPADPDAVVVGTWQPPDKLSDYAIRFCDETSRNLCLKVADLRGAAVKPKFTDYLGKDILANATPAGAGRWKGKLQLFGKEADGELVVMSENVLEMRACMLFVVCDKIVLTRAPVE